MRHHWTVAWGLTLFSAPALAQSSAAADPDTIIVTGSLFRFQPASETPQSVTTLGRDVLDQRLALSVEEALRYVPSVQPDLAPGRGFDEFLIRGFNQSRYQFRDGLRLDPGYLQQQEVHGLERIEVLKGPASVLFGQIAPGGLVNSVSKLPGTEFAASGALTAGSFGLWRITADINAPLAADGALSVRAPVAWQTQDSRTDFVSADRLFAAPSLMWKPGPDTSLAVLFLYQKDRYDRTLGLPINGSLNPSPAGRIDDSLFLGEPGLPRARSEQIQLGYLFTHRFTPGLTFRSSLRHSWFDFEGPIVQAPRPGSTDTEIRRRGFDYVADRRMLSTDNRLEATLGTTGAIEHRLLVGFDWQRYRDTNAGELFLLAPLNPFAPVYGVPPIDAGPFFDDDVTVEQTGLYGQYQARIDERWFATFGLRSAWSRTSRATSSQSDRDTTISAGLLYQASNGLSPYISFAQSFEPQVGFDPLPGGELPPPSKGEQVEGGLRWDAPGQPISLQLSAFQIRQTNIVNGDPNNPGFSTLTGSQRHRGFEAEANARIADAIDLYAAWAHLDARITSSNLGDEGLRPIDVPVNSASFYATLDGTVLDLAGSSLSLGLRHVGNRRANDLGDSLPAFTLLDAAVRARIGRVDFAFHAKNLGNARYFTAGGLRAVQIGEPRVFQASLSTRF